MKKYIHEEITHNLESPKEIVEVIMSFLSPNSVVDVGCGLGTFLNCFKRHGITNVLGVDGPWVNKELLYQYIEPNEFLEVDLEKPIKINKVFDLIICLEVAEHLAPERADSFVKDLVSLGEVILFSAAIPGQGGQNHLNEQYLYYWAEKFLAHGYIVHDVLKPFLWNKPNIYWWYKQNAVLITQKDFKFDKHLAYNVFEKVIHPELYENKINRLNTIINGELKPIHYLKFLIKSILPSGLIKKLRTKSE